MLRQLPPGVIFGIVFQVERNAGVDCGTPLGLRVDGKAPLHEFQSLLHVVETKPSAFLAASRLKPTPQSLTVR